MYLTTRQGQVPPPPRQAFRTTLPQPSASPTGPAQPITGVSDQTVENAISAEIDAFLADNTVPGPEFTRNTQASLVFDSFNGCQLQNTAELAEIDQPRAGGDLSMIDFSGASPATPTVSNSTLRGDGGVPFDPQQFNSSVAQGGAPNVTIRGHVNNI